MDEDISDWAHDRSFKTCYLRWRDARSILQNAMDSGVSARELYLNQEYQNAIQAKKEFGFTNQAAAFLLGNIIDCVVQGSARYHDTWDYIGKVSQAPLNITLEKMEP
jgi:hypothetical protein